jgi:dethiobiotin synthetase
LKLPASPHLAAQQEGITINPAKLTTATQALQRRFDHVLIEGAGGIMVPITQSLTLLDLVGQMKLPTLVVVKNELGCINHALLTINALAERQIPILGIVMNGEETGTPRDILDDNPGIIASLSGLPILATIGQLEDPITDTPDLSKVLSVLV